MQASASGSQKFHYGELDISRETRMPLTETGSEPFSIRRVVNGVDTSSNVLEMVSEMK